MLLPALLATVGILQCGQAGASAASHTGPPRGLTADGRLLWEFEALLHDVFGSHPSFATGVDNTNFACAGICSPHATWDEYHYTFARSHGSTLYLTSRTFPAGAFGNYPEPVRIKGRFIACNDTTYLTKIGGTAGFTLSCVKPS